MTNLILSVIFFFICQNAYCQNKAPWVGTNFQGIPCQGQGQGYGPYDYTNTNERSKIPIVEDYHFTPEVENHIKGKSGNIEGDLDYTLRAVPNHHKALLSAIRYQIKLNSKLLTKNHPLETPMECYLQRAIHFSPEDAASVALYAYYLKEVGQLDKANQTYQKAIQIAPDNAKIAYSYSFLLIELKQYDKAVEFAKIAYANGKTPPTLKNKLIKLGAWPQQGDK